MSDELKKVLRSSLSKGQRGEKLGCDIVGVDGGGRRTGGVGLDECGLARAVVGFERRGVRRGVRVGRASHAKRG